MLVSRRRPFRLSPELIHLASPAFALAAMLIVIFMLRPRTFSYFGWTLLFNLAVPLLFASLSQMLVICLGDIDLSVGNFVGFVTCVVAVYMHGAPAAASAILVASVVVYAGVGVLIYVRGLPSIIVTLGMAFIWLGCALLVLPSPGGEAPSWLQSFMRLRPPLIPLPILIAAAAALVGHWALKRTSYGVVLLGSGAAPRAVARAGWSMIKVRIVLYGGAGVLAVLSGVILCGLTTAGDPNIAPTYTLLGVGAVILGGGSFTGGIVSPIGTVLGALTLSMAASILSFLAVPPVWQIGAQGVILFLVLAGRVFVERVER